MHLEFGLLVNKNQEVFPKNTVTVGQKARVKSVCGHSGRTGTASCFPGGVRVPSGSAGAPRSSAARGASARRRSSASTAGTPGRAEESSLAATRSPTQVSLRPKVELGSPVVNFDRLLLTFASGRERFESFTGTA